MKSSTIKIYRMWLEVASQEAISFVDSVYKLAEDNYSAGGDTIVECMSPEEIIDEFHNLDMVKEYCGLKVEQETNTRWGEDNDDALERYDAFHQWK